MRCKPYPGRPGGDVVFVQQFIQMMVVPDSILLELFPLYANMAKPETTDQIARGEVRSEMADMQLVKTNVAKGEFNCPTDRFGRQTLPVMCGAQPISQLRAVVRQ